MKTGTRFQMSNLCLSVKKMDSPNEALTRAEEKGRFIVLGDRTLTQTAGFIHAENEVEKWESCGVLFVSQPAISPSILFVGEPDECWIGFDLEINRIRWKQPAIVEHIDLWGTFYCFLVPQDRNYVLGVHEQGIVAVNRTGGVLWHREISGLLWTYDLTPDSIVLRSDNGQTLDIPL